jgi:cyanate permease
MFFFAGAYFTILYYLPIYFQSVDNTSAVESGVYMLAMIIPLTIMIVAQGIIFSRFATVPVYWTCGGVLGAIGCGLLYTMDGATSAGKWIGYQILVGVAVGGAFNIALTNAQVHTPDEDMSQVTAIINCKTKTTQHPPAAC